MSQIQQLLDFIKDKGYATYDEVKEHAEGINPKWRAESWRRDLRNKVKLENAPIEKDMANNVIVGWRANKPTRTSFGAITSTEAKRLNTESLNGRIQKILDKVEVIGMWGELDKINSLTRILKGNNISLKIKAIERYEQEIC